MGGPEGGECDERELLELLELTLVQWGKCGSVVCGLLDLSICLDMLATGFQHGLGQDAPW